MQVLPKVMQEFCGSEGRGLSSTEGNALTGRPREVQPAQMPRLCQTKLHAVGRKKTQPPRYST